MIKERLIELLKTNKDLFAWVSSDMLEVDPEFVCHRLSLKPGSILVAQKKRKMGPERQAAIEKQVKELLDAGFIREIRYADWLSNMVMVKKAKVENVHRLYRSEQSMSQRSIPFALYR